MPSRTLRGLTRSFSFGSAGGMHAYSIAKTLADRVARPAARAGLAITNKGVLGCGVVRGGSGCVRAWRHRLGPWGVDVRHLQS